MVLVFESYTCVLYMFIPRVSAVALTRRINSFALLWICFYQQFNSLVRSMVVAHLSLKYPLTSLTSYQQKCQVNLSQNGNYSSPCNPNTHVIHFYKTKPNPQATYIVPSYTIITTVYIVLYGIIISRTRGVDCVSTIIHILTPKFGSFYLLRNHRNLKSIDFTITYRFIWR